jgi:NADH:ubiquinone oxidoreductase subunit 6 (subunit J)
MSRTHLPVNNSVLELDVWDEKTLDIIYTSLAYNINSEGFLEWLKDINMYELKNNKFFSNSIVIFFELNYLDKNNIYYLLEKGYYWDIFINNYTFFTLKTRLVAEIFFINFFSIFLKKKIILFTFFNFFLVILMLYNLYKLYDAINLIYALLHFLYFAILAGLLILLWGSTYLAFCIILIYGAAIPVLALYIIMLVNVDLIQRLFFFEHINKKKISERYKGLLILIFFSIYSIFCFRQINLELIASELPWLQEIYQITTYFSLMKRQFDLSLFSNNYPTIFDLVLSFYSSDLDKVASAAFRTSYNELLALVFLLLIAIIVVISISRPTYLTTKPVFNPILDERHFIWDYVYFMYLARMVFINNLQNVLSF